MNDNHLKMLREVLSTPTAPFREDAVVRLIHRWASDRGLDFARDQAGNVLVRYTRGRRTGGGWVFSAHMDHPGFVVLRQRGQRVWADFRGGVGKGYFPGSRVRLLGDGLDVRGTVKVRREARKDELFPVCTIELDERVEVPPGTPGMWDVPVFRHRGQRISARACDDLAGVASVLCAIDELAAAKTPANVTGMFTRAEEAGFVGAIAAAKAGTLDEDALLVAIETSAAQPRAKLGDGVVVRVGDRTLTFDPPLTAAIAATAAKLATTDADFRWARQLMPGGTCESTAFAALGLRAGALCIPLGNYHNQGPGERIAPEQIDIGDFGCLVKLLVGLAREPANLPRRRMDDLRKRLDGLLKQRGRLLQQ
jgi:endoglucanase